MHSQYIHTERAVQPPLIRTKNTMCQCVRNLTDDFDGFLKDKRYLIHDRDDKFSKKFDKTLRDAGVEAVVLPPRSPNLNAYAERAARMYYSIPLNPPAGDPLWRRQGEVPGTLNYITIEFSPAGGAPIQVWIDGLGLRKWGTVPIVNLATP